VIANPRAPFLIRVIRIQLRFVSLSFEQVERAFLFTPKRAPGLPKLRNPSPFMRCCQTGVGTQCCATQGWEEGWWECRIGAILSSV